MVTIGVCVTRILLPWLKTGMELIYGTGCLVICDQASCHEQDGGEISTRN